MCLLALFFRAVDDAAVVVGANREEAYARGGEPPRVLPGPVPSIAGIDPQAKGTWLGVNRRGVLVAVTNRPKSRVPERRRSRGLLARDLLACTNAREATDLGAKELSHDGYAGCNVLCADRHDAYALHSGDWLRIRPLPPGLHVMTAHDVNETNDPRIAHALGWLGQRRYYTGLECIVALQELCAQGGGDGPLMCIRSELGGTVSSTIVALRAPLTRSTYLHAQGPPDTTPYQDYSHLLEELASTRSNGE
jgi:uncharacterized protein with NRDE domain